MILVSLVLAAGTAAAQQQFGTGQQFAGKAQGAPQPVAQPGMQSGAQQPAYAGGQPSTGVLNIPPAPAKPVANGAYGNTERAAILGEQLSNASQGNANVYVSENPNRTVSLDVHLLTSGDPYSMAGTMANLTYMVDSIYGMTDMKGSDVLLTVYDPSGAQITVAKFSDANNAFEYYNVPPQAATQPTTGQPTTGQPTTGQPGMGQTGVSQPGFGQQGRGQSGITQPSFGQR